MAFKSFSKNYTSPSDQALREGKSPYNETIGPYRSTSPDSFRNNFVSKLNKNPDFKGFYQQAFGADTAQESQNKINTAYKSREASFVDDRNNKLANDFLAKYSEGVSRGLVEEDRAVFPENLAKLVTENATQGSNTREPNTVGAFPSQGVNVG